jgi:hypothetical protein
VLDHKVRQRNSSISNYGWSAVIHVRKVNDSQLLCNSNLISPALSIILSIR